MGRTELMHITIVTGPFYPVPPAPCGAVERLMRDLAEEFAAAGNQVTVLCRHWPGQAKDETLKGVRYLRRTRLSHTRSIKWDLVQDLWYSMRMLSMLPRGDVTVTNVFWLPALLRLRRRRAGAVVVNVNRWPKRQMKLYRNAARLAAASSAIRDEIIRQAPGLEPLVKVMPNPIDTRIFKPPERPRASRAGNATIVYTGRVHPEKGIHLLVEAFRRLTTDRFEDVRLRIIGATTVAGGGGGDEYVAALKAAAEGSKVEFVDAIYDRAALVRELQGADIYCYPSLAEVGEAMPVAPLEAMATGLPAVTSDLPQFRDYLEPGVNGLVFDRRSADPAAELAAALRTLVNDVELRERYGREASASASRFDTASVARMYLDDFQNLVSEK